ncbi:MAG: DUF1254 domain-containing protein [Burkholderiaceae bacterium]
MRKLSTPADRWVTTPNNDTLLSSAWLDLSTGPVVLTVPDTAGRYYSVALIDSYTNNFAILGRRTTGTRAGEFVVVGPRWGGTLPETRRVLRAPTDDVLVFVRVLVDGDADLPAARAIQDTIRLAPLDPGPAAPGWAPATAAPTTPDSREYLELVNAMLERNPPPAHEAARVEAFAAVGVGGARCAWDALAPEVRQRWSRELAGLYALLRDRTRMIGAPTPLDRPPIPGWSAGRATMGDWGTDYAYRAFVALGGLLALPHAEAIYLAANADATRAPLDGRHRYRLRIPAQGLPVDAFWSLTLYQVEPDGRRFLVENPLGRYSIGDRTPGLRHGPDGSLDLAIQHPTPADAANWLPAPSGRFDLFLRAYQPRADFLDGRVPLPPVERID